VVSFQGVVIGMKLGCERRLGGSEPKKKKKKGTYRAEGRSGLVGMQQKSNLETKASSQ